MDKHKDNFGAVAAVAFLVVASCFYYSWKVVLPKHQENKTALARANKEIESAQAKLDSLKSVETQLASLGETVEKLFVAIPSKADEPNLISELEAVAKKHQLIIPTISISTGDENGSASMSDGSTASPTNRVRVSFSVTGNFDSLSQFVASVEKDLRFSNIKNINIAASEDEMSLSLSIDVYMRANNQPVQDQSAQTMMTPGMMPTQ